MKYNTVLFDLDDTLIDFTGREFISLKKAMAKHGLDLTHEEYELYEIMNKELWQSFEKGYFTKKELLSLRFELFFAQTGKTGDAAQLNHDYLVAMGEEALMYDETLPMLTQLKVMGVKMALVTNGAEMAQKIKLKTTGLDKLFPSTVISDAAGVQKPDTEIFDIVHDTMGGFDKETTLMVGDKLKSDIKGGRQYGIDTCWFNPLGDENTTDERPTYEIQNLTELTAIVKGLSAL